jgi:hypothetical protein
MRSAALLLLAGLAGLALASAAGVAVTLRIGILLHDSWAVLCFAGYAAGFYVFVVGLGAYLRARMSGAVGARVVLFAVLFAIAVGPWIVAAIAGILTDHWAREWFVVAAPSPFFVFVMIDALSGDGARVLIPAGIVASAAWASIGLVFLAAASRTCRRIIRRHEETLAETERILAEEDAAAEAGPPADAPADAPANGPPESLAEEPAPETLPTG